MKFLHAFVCLIVMLALFTTASASALSVGQCKSRCQKREDRESCEKGCQRSNDRWVRRISGKAQ